MTESSPSSARGEERGQLSKRVLTAALLVPVVVGAVLYLPSIYVALLFALLVLIGAWEWAGLMGWMSNTARWAYTLLFVPALFLAHFATGYPAGRQGLLLIGMLWWSMAFVRVLGYQRGQVIPIVRASLLRGGMGVVALIPAWAAVVILHSQTDGPYWLLFLLCLIWVADIGAYFVGRRFGRRRLADRVSPGKTWEGVIGGAVAVALLAWAVSFFANLQGESATLFVLLCLATVPVSVLGDLTESLFKRQAGVKDSGRLLPGHGGMLDRIDSLTAAAPFFVFGLHWLGV